MYKKDRQIRNNNDRQTPGGTLARVSDIDNYEQWATIVKMIFGRNNFKENLKQFTFPPGLNPKLVDFANSLNKPKQAVVHLLWALGLEDEIINQQTDINDDKFPISLEKWGFSPKSVESKGVSPTHVLEDAAVDGLELLVNAHGEKDKFKNIKWEEYLPKSL